MAVEVPRRVHEGLEAARLSGADMYDRVGVLDRLEEGGDQAAAYWISQYRAAYKRGVREGFAAVDDEPYPDAVRKELADIEEDLEMERNTWATAVEYRREAAEDHKDAAAQVDAAREKKEPLRELKKELKKWELNLRSAEREVEMAERGLRRLRAARDRAEERLERTGA